MPRTGTFLEANVSYYSNLAFNSLAAMRTTQEELRTGQFDTSKVIGRGVNLWLDALEGWWSALLVTASEPLPTVLLRLDPHSTTDSKEVRVLVPQDPEFTGLQSLNGGPQASVVVKVKSSKDGLEVKLIGLIDNKRPAAGLYMGLVYLGTKPLAIVMLLVDEPARRQPHSRKRARDLSKLRARQPR